MAEFTQQYQQEIERMVKTSVQDPQLQTELIDHCCCSIEEQLHEGMSFEEAFAITLRELAPHGMHEIESQVKYILTPQIPFTMKITKYFFGFVAAMFILIGFTFKAFHWPMASQIMFIGFVSLATSMLALLTSAIRFSSLYPNRLSTISGGIGGFTFSIGCIFKLMHWPGASMISLLGMAVITLIFVPLFFWRLYQADHGTLKRAE